MYLFGYVNHHSCPECCTLLYSVYSVITPSYYVEQFRSHYISSSRTRLIRCRQFYKPKNTWLQSTAVLASPDSRLHSPHVDMAGSLCGWISGIVWLHVLMPGPRVPQSWHRAVFHCRSCNHTMAEDQEVLAS